MKRLIIIAILMSLIISGFSQSVLFQSNNKSTVIKQKIDTLKLNLSTKLNLIEQSLRNFQSKDVLTILDSTDVNGNIQGINKSLDTSKTAINAYLIVGKSLDKTIQDKRSQLVATTKRKSPGYQTEVIKLNKQVADLQKQSKNNDNLITEVRKKQVSLEEQLKIKTSELENQVFEKFRDQEIILSLNLEKHQTLIDNLKDEFSQLQKAASSTDSSFGKKDWIEHKLISDDDQRKITVLTQEMTLALDKAKRAIDALQEPLTNFGDVIKTLTKKRDKIALLLSFGNIPAFIDTIKREIGLSNSNLKTLEESEHKVLNDVTKSNQILKEAQTLLLNKQAEIASVYRTYKNDADSSESDLKTIASITQALGSQSQIIPGISLLGFNTKNAPNSSVGTQLKLFVTANSQEKNVITGNNKLFIPEASTFGFMADFAFGFIPSVATTSKGPGNQPFKRLALNLGGYYLGKSLVREKDTSNFNIGMVQFKAGMQYIVIGNALSVYANVNPFFISSGVKDYEENFSNVKKLKAYVDFGLECYLKLNKDQTNGLFINMDLGFISRGGDVQSIVTSSDPLIPKIKLGIVKAFAF